MIERKGDLFSTELTVIGHGVNTVGVMGAGVAKIVRQRFPNAYETYKRDCHKDILKPGSSMPCKMENGKIIMNIASQRLPGADARLSWLATGVEEAVQDSLDWGYKSMALPKIGCGIGGLSWIDVNAILHALEKDYDFEFEVWTL